MAAAQIIRAEGPPSRPKCGPNSSPRHQRGVCCCLAVDALCHAVALACECSRSWRVGRSVRFACSEDRPNNVETVRALRNGETSQLRFALRWMFQRLVSFDYFQRSVAAFTWITISTTCCCKPSGRPSACKFQIRRMLKPPRVFALVLFCRVRSLSLGSAPCAS